MASKVRGCKSFTQAVISQETFQLSTFPPILMDLRKYISPICGRAMIWPCGPTDKASDYESGDCRFESCQGQTFLPPKCRKEWKKIAPPGGLEPPTFRLTAERASRLRHGGSGDIQVKIKECTDSYELSKGEKSISHAGSWTRASWVKARYPSR